MISKRNSAIFLILFVSVSSPGVASDKTGPCSADASKLCSGVNIQALASCLDSHQPELSPSCRAWRQQMSQNQLDLMACSKDVERLCPKINDITQRSQCIQLHEKELSSDCRRYRKWADEQTKRLIKGTLAGECADAIQTICKDVKPGQGRLRDCLKQNENNVSPGCKEQVEKLK